MKKLLLAVSGLLAISGSAFAADMPVKAPMAASPPPMSWSGCYVDGGIGYGMYNVDHYGLTAAGPFDLPSTSGGRGWLGRVGVGCDYQFAPKWVIGALADYDFMNIHGTLVDPFGAAGAGVQLNEKENNAWYAGARIGYVIAPGVLTYVDGGWTETHFGQGAFVTSAAGAPTVFALTGQRYHGWFLGSGFETTLSDYLPGLPTGLFLRTEYRFSSYNSANDLLVPGAGIAAGAAENIHPYVQTVTTSLVWKFNVFGH